MRGQLGRQVVGQVDWWGDGRGGAAGGTGRHVEGRGGGAGIGGGTSGWD